MRADMQKIIVERPRYGSTIRNFKTQKSLHSSEVRSAVEAGDGFDSGPNRASSARRNKQLNENLAPLRRYLAKQIGRPWDKVFSEIRATLDTRSAIGLHVMQHIEDFIALKTLMRENVVYQRRCWSGLAPVEGLYVHPLTGLIRYIKPKPRRRWNAHATEKEPNFVRASENAAYQKLDGIWFHLEYGIDAEGMSVLLSKRQCDSKTIRRIERGDLGPLTVPPYKWPPQR